MIQKTPTEDLQIPPPIKSRKPSQASLIQLIPFVISWPLPPFFKWKRKSTDTIKTSLPSEFLVQDLFLFPYPSFTSKTPFPIEDELSQN